MSNTNPLDGISKILNVPLPPTSLEKIMKDSSNNEIANFVENTNKIILAMKEESKAQIESIEKTSAAEIDNAKKISESSSRLSKISIIISLISILIAVISLASQLGLLSLF